MPNKPYSSELEDPLETNEPEPLGFWEQKQRELLTSVVDYNLSTLYDLIQDRNIDLSPIYQRRDRWDDVRQSSLIESFLMNVPVPPIFLNEDAYGQYSVIDGRQRLNTIFSFISGALRLRGLEVFSDINDKTIRELPSRLQSVIKTRPTLRAVIILRQSDPDVKYEVFRRLNTGGVKLNAQEVRNSVFTGPLNKTLVKLSENKDFHRMLGITTPSKSSLYQEMGDVELVLRFFTFRTNWEQFPGGITRQMDQFMEGNRDMPSEELKIAEADFLRALSITNACFGENSFRRWNPETGKWRNQILAALYDTQMLAFRDYSLEQIVPKRTAIVEGFQKLFDYPDFQKAIKASIALYFVDRVKAFQNVINQAIGG